LERTPPSPGVEQADPGYDWIMETIVVGYDGTEHADRGSCVQILEQDHQRMAAQLERGRER